mgnify:CR=1 FL=1
MSGDDYFVIKPHLADRALGPFGQNKDVIAVRDQRMICIHRVDPAEARDVAKLDVNAGNIVLALCLGLGLGPVLLQIVHRCCRHPQAAVLPYRDPCGSPVQAQHIPVDGVAGEHEAGKVVVRINGHIGNGGLEGGLHPAREADLHGRAAGLAVLAQKLFALFCRSVSLYYLLTY